MENIKITDEEKEFLLQGFEEKQKKRYISGKIIVITITLLNIICAIVYSFINFSFINLVIQLVLSITLFYGFSQVTYIFAAVAAFSTFRSLIYLTDIISCPSIPVILFILIYMVFYIFTSIFMFKSKSVSDFLHSKNNPS
ncbi:hypothetical protein N3C_0953 [Clostridium sp. N3C]|uniref:hypothetical protein n=1 Tax=Clostridium sp. N3C TaxID=1776758 RepID=UPI00092E1516|nr:hypothetical protein [Clostridium sp. N3C]SCN22773.1 hypothetical protein N3C_0953 [Clostridium sp. N3C]